MPGLIRIIILGIIIAFVAGLVKKLQQNQLQRNAKKAAQEKNKMMPKKTVQCDQCGLYVLTEESLHHDDKNFCCQQHQDEFEK